MSLKHMRMRSCAGITRLFILVAVVALLGGCSSGDKDLDTANNQARNAGDAAETVENVTGNQGATDDSPKDPDGGSGTSTDNDAGTDTDSTGGADTDTGTDSSDTGSGSATDNTGGTGDTGTDATDNGTGTDTDPLGPGIGTDDPEEECLLPPDPNDRGRMTNLVVGEPLPELSLPALLDSSTVDLHALRGKWVVLKFWASWCPSCKELASSFISPLYEEFGKTDDSRLQLISIGLTINDSPQKQTAEVRTKRHAWTHLYDEDNAAREAFKIFATPTFIVIDPDGNVVTWGRPRKGWEEELRAFLVQECLDKQ